MLGADTPGALTLALLTMTVLTLALLTLALLTLLNPARQTPTRCVLWLYHGFNHCDSTCDGSTYHRYAYHGSTHYTLFTSCHQVLGQLKASVVVLGGWCIFDQVSTASKRYVTKSAPWCIRSPELHS